MASIKKKINELTPKADPVLADSIVISDSENSGKGALVEITDLQTLIGGGAVDSVAGKTGVVTLDADDVSETATKLWFTDTQSTKLAGIAEGAEVNTVDSVAGRTGDVTLDADDVSPTSTKLWMSDTQSTKLAGIAEGAEVNTVDSVAGKTGDVTLDASDIAETDALKILTATERTKLAGIEEGAEANDVTSVAGKTGAVTLDASDIAETETLKILTATERTKLTGIEEGAEVNDVTSVAGKTGVVTLDASDIAETETLKILTSTERTKLTGIEEGAEVNDVTSVAGRTGAVTLDADDVAPTTSKLWMSDTQSAKLAGIAENANNYTHPASHPQSMIEGLADALAGKAPLASPALTGTPTAPTAASGTDTTQIATTAFVTGALASKANDADVVKLTGNQSIGGTKTFTTSPVLPTPTAGDNTTKGATTAFVTGAVAACRPKHTYVPITTASTAIDGEKGKTYGINANSCTITLPAYNTSGYVDGDEICVVLGVTASRELTITSPSYILRGSGLQPFNTPFNVTGFGTFISFVKSSNVWMMSYPEYELALKAPLASPALTGTPTAPTAASGTDTTQIATTAFVQAQKASPALTGTPTAPTAASGTDTTQIATTAFVQAKAAGALLTEGTPSGPSATGTKGMIRYDANYVYICTATDTWIRIAKDGSWT